MYLNNHTYYSLRYGTLSPEELLQEARQNQVECMALTDINNTSACLHFIRMAPQYGVKPLTGIDFRNDTEQMYIGIARNNEGFFELNRFLSHHLHTHEKFPEKFPEINHVYVIYPFRKKEFPSLREYEYIGIQPRDLPALGLTDWKKVQHKLVVLQPVTFRNPKDFNAHRLLRAIDKNTLLSKLSKTEEGDPQHKMFPVEEIQKKYVSFPFILENTRSLLENCSIYFEFGSEYPPKNQKYFTSSETADHELLRRLCWEGVKYRYPHPGDHIFDRISKELEVIRQKKYTSYFLINWDMVNYARKKGYFYVGRGSGANSMVAYLLRITDVDPVELDLYFERFINLYRKNPPDFDIDFSWKDRDDVIDYIFNKYRNVALLTTYNTFQYRAVIREIGKVFGLPPREIEMLAEQRKNPHQLDHMATLVLKYGRLIHGFPSHLGIHAGGILISEKPLQYYTATFMPPKGYPTTQFDMITAEDIGLYKFDVLSQRGLGKIKDTLGLIQKNRPGSSGIDIHDINRFKKDKKVKYLLRNAKAMGCFYVESPAMRMLLKKLQVDHYLGLVAASSVIRPGVAKSGMMKEYILRYRQPERRKEGHPVLLNIMPETYGIMVYQEDVIKVAHYFAGLTLSEADVLRRGMSGKFRSREEFKTVEEKFFANCLEKGYEKKTIKTIWTQIESFAGYAFAKGHSASYAVESYQSLFLKAHFPLEFMVAVINNFGGFYRTEFYIHEARMWGANIHAPCINHSESLTTIYTNNIYLGFNLIQGIETQTSGVVLTERNKNGLFLNLDDFMERVSLSIEQISLLIRINAFRFTGIHKHELMWKAYQRINGRKCIPKQADLFSTRVPEYSLPHFEANIFEEAFDQMELLGFTLYSPFIFIKKPPFNHICAIDLVNYKGTNITLWGYLVTIKTAITSNGKRMNFGTFLDQNGSFFDTTHFPGVAETYPFRGRGVYAITGKVVEEFDFYSIEVSHMVKEPVMEDPRYSERKS